MLSRSSTAEHTLAARTENTLQERASVLLARRLVLLGEVDGAILRAKALIDVVRRRAHSS